MDSSQQLISLLQRSTARLSVPTESGTGFFVAPGLILTCAHVVGNGQGDQGVVTVEWEGQTYRAKVTQLLPAPYPDLALLQLEKGPSIHPCVFLHEAVRVADSLYSYGYPRTYPNGDSTSFVFEGLTGDPKKLLKFKLGEAVPGFSGSPLLNLQTGGVCGVMNVTRGQNTLMGGRGIPSSVVLEQLPKLVSLQKEFHYRDSRWYDFLTPQQRQVLGIVRPDQPAGAIEVYYSFAKEDEALAKELQKHLTLLKHEGYISEWYPSEVALGEEPSELNKQHLNTARIILLLVSPDFLFEKVAGEQDNYEVELAMKKSQTGTIVIPIRLRRINNWDLAKFGRLVSLPRNGRPVDEWSHRDAAFAEIAGEIRKVVDRLRSRASIS